MLDSGKSSTPTVFDSYLDDLLGGSLDDASAARYDSRRDDEHDDRGHRLCVGVIETEAARRVFEG